MAKTSMMNLDNENLMCYCKFLKNLSNVIIIIVNLVPFNAQSGTVKLPSRKLGISNEQPFLAHDILSDGKYFWQRQSYPIQLNLNVIPARVFKLKKQLRREEDIDYFV